MKFTINSGVLADSIAAAITSLPTNATVPIMGGVLVEAQLGAVTFSSFNYDRATTRVAAADVMDTDTAVTSGRLLAVVGGNLPKNGESTVTADESEMVIATGRTEFRLPLMHAADYPKLPDLTSQGVLGTIGCAVFAEAARVIGGFAAVGPQPAGLSGLTALNIATEPGWLTMRATDRYVIGRRRLEWDGRVNSLMNVPAADVLATIKALAGTGTEDIEILCSETLLGMRTKSTTVVTRLLADEFPSVERMLKSDGFYSAATVPTAELASMLKRAKSIADDEHSKVNIVVEADTLSVSTTDSTGGIVDSIDAEQHGGGRRLAMSSRRLLNAIAAIDDDQITLAFQESGYLVSIFPGAIEPGRSGNLVAPDTDTVAVLMGIRSAR